MKTLQRAITKSWLIASAILPVLILSFSSVQVNAQKIVIEPGFLNMNESNSFTIRNTGETRLNYVVEINTSFRTFHYNSLTELNSYPVSPGPDDSSAILNEALWTYEVPYTENANTSLYTYGLYGALGAGNINGQMGWSAEGENWKVVRPYSHIIASYMCGLSDGSGVPSAMFSPRVVHGSENVSSFSIDLNLGFASGSTWQIIPQNHESVVTRLQVNPEGTLQVLVRDNSGHASFQLIPAVVPNGTFTLSMEVDRKTALFTIFFNGQRVFTGKGFTNYIEQLALLTLNEKAGSALFANSYLSKQVGWGNDFTLNGGSSLILINEDYGYYYGQQSKVTGFLDPGESVTRDPSIATSDLLPGVYYDSIKIFSNDPDRARVVLPFSLAVEIPYTPPTDYQSPPVPLELRYDPLEVTIYKRDTTSVNLTLTNRTSLSQSVFFPTPTEIPLYKAFSHGSQNFQWKDISTTGTSLTLGDDDSQTVMIPFSGPITIGSNGYLVYGATQADSPDNRQMNDTYTLLSNTLAPYWDDLAPDELSGIYYQGNDEEFIVQYTNVPFKGTDIRNTFQVILYRDGAIKFQYLHMNDRQSATIAIVPGKDNPGYFRMDIANNEPFVRDSLAVLFQQPNFPKTPVNENDISGGYSFYPWILYPPEGGSSVDPMSSQSISIRLVSSYGLDDTIQELPVGVFKSNIFLLSHPFHRESYDPDELGHHDAGAFVVPITITVLENIPPVLGALKKLTLAENQSLEFSIMATDQNDTTLVLSLNSIPDFITPIHFGNKFMTYTLAPRVGDKGAYSILVKAADPHGAFDLDTLYVTVTPYCPIKDFSLTYFKSNREVSRFADMVTLDVADPEIEKYTIRANPAPGRIGSVRFTLDGRTINTDNTEPFTINNWVLPGLSAGLHALRVQAFSRDFGWGDAFEVTEVIIDVTNTAAVTQFVVADRNGNPLGQLVEGAVINIGDPEWNGFNVLAVTNQSTIRSVKFELNGVTARIDNRAPYAISGTSSGYEKPWTITPGTYMLTATPYMKYYGWGPPGIPLSVQFTIINLPSASNQLAGDLALQNEVTQRDTERIRVYPNPVKDVLHVQLLPAEGAYRLRLMNTSGQVLYTQEGSATQSQELIIPTHQLELRGGMYYLQLTRSNGFQQTVRIVKQ